MKRIDNNHEFSYSLVSNYERWLNSEKDWNKYYGTAENPPCPDEFELSRKLEFYAQLFKLTFKPEFERDDTAMALGREFENVLSKQSDIISSFKFKSNRGDEYIVLLNDDIQTLYNNRFKNKPRQQVEIKGVLPNGLNYIGYADEVYDNCIIDIKTTSNFSKANYDNSLQVALYLHFIDDFLVQRGFYQVTEFYRPTSGGVKKNEFVMKDTFMIESECITDKQLIEFSEFCEEILKNASSFEADLANYKDYFQTFNS